MSGLTLKRHNELISYTNHIKSSNLDDRYVFECHLTVDERYFVLHDEVFDIQEQTKLGNIWSSLDIFKTIFKNVSVDNPEYRQIQESFSKLPILENQNNLYKVRDYLLEFDVFTDTWLGRQAKSAGQGISDFAKTSYDGLKKLGVSIGQGEWTRVLDLLKKGVLFVLRGLKDAAYSTVGMIVDAILIATGVGKTAQVVVWGLITALDVYQISTNNWPAGDNREELWKYLDLGFDLLGLVFAGVAAKGARAVFKPLSGLSVKNMASKVAQSPKMKTLVQNMLSATKSGGGKLASVQASILKKWPAGAKFINVVLGFFEGIMKKLQTYLGKITSTSNLKNIKNVNAVPGSGFIPKVKTAGEFLKRGAVGGGIAGGLSYGLEKIFGGEDKGMDNDDLENLTNSDIKPVFNYDDI